MTDSYLNDHHAVIGSQYTGAIHGPAQNHGKYRSRRTIRRWAKKVGIDEAEALGEARVILNRSTPSPAIDGKE